MRVTGIFKVPEGMPSLELPLYVSRVSAGLPSPVEADKENFDLYKHLIINKRTTFLLRVSGDSMTGAGMYDNDILVVDQSLDPLDGHVAVVVLDGEYTVKRLCYEADYLLLLAENPAYPPIKITIDQLDQYCRVWGIVTNVIHSVLPSVRPS